VDVSLARRDGRLYVNLVNTAGRHAVGRVETLDEIPPIGPLRVSVAVAARPATVRLQPAGEDLPFDYRDGRVEVLVPKVDILDIVEVTSDPGGPR
jgi:hypothetical protein